MNARQAVVDAVLAELYADLLKLQRDLAQSGQAALVAELKASVEAAGRTRALNDALAAYVKSRIDDVGLALATHRDEVTAAVTAARVQGRSEAAALLRAADERAGRRFVGLATLLVCSVASNLVVLGWLLARSA